MCASLNFFYDINKWKKEIESLAKMPWSHTLKMKQKKLQFSEIKSFHNEINRKTTGKRYKNFKKPLSRFFSRKFTLTKSQIHGPRMGNPLSKWKLTTFHFNWNKNMLYSLTNQITSKYYLPFPETLRTAQVTHPEF